MVSVKYVNTNNGEIIEINHVGVEEYKEIPNRDVDDKLYYIHDDVEYFLKGEHLEINDSESIMSIICNTVNMSTLMDFQEWIALNKEEGTVYLPKLGAQDALNFIKDYLLGKDWYKGFTGSQGELNAEIVAAIVERYAEHKDETSEEVAAEEEIAVEDTTDTEEDSNTETSPIEE